MKLMEFKLFNKPVLLKKILLIIFAIPFFSLQINSYRNFTISDGLLDNSIVDINQDNYGQLWVITKSSVSIFDGSQWKNYSTKFQHQDNPFNSFLIDYNKILIDAKDNKYFLSSDGRVFHFQNNTLKELISPFQAKGIFFRDIQLVDEGEKQTIWASTEKNGLAYFDNVWFSFGEGEGLISDKILTIKSYGNLLVVITDKGIQFIKDRRVVYTFVTTDLSKSNQLTCAFDKYSKVKDNIPAIWILSNNRLLKLESEKIIDQTFNYFNPFRENYSHLFTNGGNKLFLANKNYVKIINPVTKEMQVLSKESGIIGSPQVLFVDAEKNLWIGTDRGLTRINFTNVLAFTDEEGLSDIKIIASRKDGKDIYLGHTDGRISIFSNSKIYQLNYQNQLNAFSSKIQKTNTDIVKITSINNKIIFQSGDWGIFEIRSRSSINPVFIVQNKTDFINDFLVTEDGGLIISGKFTISGGNSNILSLKSKIDLSNEELLNNAIKKIYLSKDGSILFISNNNQILRLHRGKVERINLPDLDFSKITLIKEDKGSNLFIGTDNGFIVLMKSGEIKSYLQTKSDEVGVKQEVHSFYFDDLNNLWIMTSNGLKFWNWKEFKVSSEWKKITPNSLNEDAIDELDNKIIVAADNGLFILPSDEEEIREIQPRIYISEILIDGKSHDAFTEIKLEKINTLKIRYNAVLLSTTNNFEFSYKLDGFDKDWSTPTKSKEINYVNLPDGEYKFMVRVRLNYSEWSIPVSSRMIKIKKPLYYHYEFLVIFILSVAIIVLVIYTLESNKELTDKKLRSFQQQIQGLEKQNKQLRLEINKALELSKSRMTFLASLSHELRTPINSIIGFIDILLDSKLNLTEEERIKYLNFISVNSRRLLILINDIIDLAKIDAGTITLEYSDVNLNAEVRDTINLFREKIKQKQLDLILELDPELENHFAYLDRNRLHQIISNLITNAIKFTEEGFIKISTKKEDEKIVLSVEDTGIGIPEGEINFIFEEFRRSSIAIRKSIEGTGLGLSITKRLVELMRGEIKVESQEGIGTTFTILFPTSRETNKQVKKEFNPNLN